MVQIDGIISGDDAGGKGQKQVIVLAATNAPWDLDEAIRYIAPRCDWEATVTRRSRRRLEKRVYIPLPNSKDRGELFRIHTESLTLADDVDMDELAVQTNGACCPKRASPVLIHVDTVERTL
jgi:katanin p60 ATPase-containing subunit A1